jgi:hypothetical protein
MGVDYLITWTGAPICTRSNKSLTSWLRIRMQPLDAAEPIDDGALVP